MEPLDLAEYKWNIRVRQSMIDDFDALIAMQTNCFPGRAPWRREHIVQLRSSDPSERQRGRGQR